MSEGTDCRRERSNIEEQENHISCVLNFPKRDGFVSDRKNGKSLRYWWEKSGLSQFTRVTQISHAPFTKKSARTAILRFHFRLPQIFFYTYFLDLITNEFFLISDLVHEKLQNLTKKAGALFRERPRQVETGFGLRNRQVKGPSVDHETIHRSNS